MALQLALSFGHVHTLRWQSGTQIAAIDAPAKDSHDDDAPGIVCDICAVMRFAAAALPAASPAIVLPVASGVGPATPVTAAPPRAAHRIAAFQPRGPPTV